MIILHTTKYSDNSLIIHGYSLDKGRIGLILRGVHTNGGKKRNSWSKGNSISILHPLNIIDVEVYENHKGGMESIKEYSPRFQLNSIRSDITKSSMTMFISELLYRTLVTPEKDELMYDFIVNSILLLEGLTGSAANFHLWFMICYCERLGFAPIGDFGSEFDPFSEEEKNILKELYSGTFAQAMDIQLNAGLRRSIIESIIKYMEYHTGSRIKLNSLPVLQTIFRV
ncbi:MAG: recombination protein O N-terminal domain-containing protein [Bacteroidales bacterium]|nr:recombination protein O N-terminal domain-containing protein [Bacteroidales bacterium]